MPPTLEDVARAAGVARSTAGLVLNGRASELGIGAACVRRVERAADKLGYVGNFHARTLALGRSNTLGLVWGAGMERSFHSAFWSPIALGIEDAARAHGMDVLVIGPGPARHPFERAIAALRSRRIDGLLAVGGPACGLDRADNAKLGPVVFMQDDQGTGRPVVRLDVETGLREGVRHLAALGHRRVLWLGTAIRGEARDPARAAAFRRAASAHGMRVEEKWLDSQCARVEPPDQIARYCKAIRSAAPVAPGVTAVMCYNDAVAAGLVAALQAEGRRVPEDVSVIGFDDLFSRSCVPPLTTVSHCLPQMGAKAVDLVLALIQGQPAARRKAGVPVASKLIVRRSTGRPPGGAEGTRNGAGKPRGKVRA